MEWYNIVSIIVGALGGVTGFIGLYKAKSEKEGIDIENMHKMLEDAHDLYNSAREEKKAVSKEFHDYKEEINKYVSEFKLRFHAVEKRLDATERAIIQGYRCPYPPRIEDCPIIRDYEKKHCAECVSHNEKVDE